MNASSEPMDAKADARLTPLLLTVPEACRRLRMSRWALYRLINQNKLRTIKLGNEGYAEVVRMS
jgi:excisionase family DNA binding protein